MGNAGHGRLSSTEEAALGPCGTRWSLGKMMGFRERLGYFFGASLSKRGVLVVITKGIFCRKAHACGAGEMPL